MDGIINPSICRNMQRKSYQNPNESSNIPPKSLIHIYIYIYIAVLGF